MTTYQEQRKFIESLKLEPNQSRRFNCPFCRGKNTFSVSNVNGKLFWNCFKASCSIAGIAKNSPSKQDINNMIKSISENKIVPTTQWEVPNYFTTIIGHEDIYDLLQYYNSFNAFIEHRIDVRFDPKLNRLVFLIKYNNRVCGGIGKALNKDVRPKWYKYGNIDTPLIVYPPYAKSEKVGVLVEDAFSACAAAEAGCIGIALLGTVYFDAYTAIIYSLLDRCIVALDKDATKKSLSIEGTLKPILPIETVILDNDLKYYSIDQIKKILKFENSS